jgi:hypothetical protein
MEIIFEIFLQEGEGGFCTASGFLGPVAQLTGIVFQPTAGAGLRGSRASYPQGIPQEMGVNQRRFFRKSLDLFHVEGSVFS